MIKLGISLAQHLAEAASRVERGGRLCAQVDGFDLHGRVAFGPADRKRLEELVRYGARPSLARDRLTLEPDGHYLLRLKTRWLDGTTHLRMEPIELMERLAAQIPKPRVNQVLYAGVLAPNAKLRAKAVAYGRPAPASEPPSTERPTRAERETWAALMRVTFDLDVLTCPRCGARMRHVATVLEARVARRILSTSASKPAHRHPRRRAYLRPSGRPLRGTAGTRRSGERAPLEDIGSAAWFLTSMDRAELRSEVDFSRDLAVCRPRARRGSRSRKTRLCHVRLVGAGEGRALCTDYPPDESQRLTRRNQRTQRMPRWSELSE